MQEREKNNFTMMETERYINSAEAAQFLSVSIQTVKNWRKKSIGPQYTKIGRIVRYKILDLIQYAEEKKINPQKSANYEN